MNTYEVITFGFAWTKKHLAKKAEDYLNEIHKQGKQEVISVSFSQGAVFITLKKI